MAMFNEPRMIPDGKTTPCDACGELPDPSFPKLYCDSDSRGWLCFPCFSVLDTVEHQPDRIKKLAAWIKRHRT